MIEIIDQLAYWVIIFTPACMGIWFSLAIWNWTNKWSTQWI